MSDRDDAAPREQPDRSARKRAERPGRFVYADEKPAGRRLLTQLKWLAIASVAVVAIGFGAGWLFGNTNSGGAARSVLGPKVVTEPEVAPTATPTGLPSDFALAPTSGTSTAEPRCGVASAPVATDVQVATIMAGAVIVQYDPDAVGPEGRDELEAFVDDYASHVLVAPNPRLDDPVVATAFRSRLRLDTFDVEALGTFVTGYGQPQGDADACPT